MPSSEQDSTPLEKSFSRTITSDFLEKANDVSRGLSQEKIFSGVYLRDGTGRILEGCFMGHHINNELKQDSDDIIEWPDIDIVIDLETHTIFADKGRFYLKSYHIEEGREPATFSYFYNGQNSHLLQSGWYSLGWHDYTKDEYGKWIAYRSDEGKRLYSECLEATDADFSGTNGKKLAPVILAMLSLQRYFSFKDKVLEMSAPVNFGKFIPAKYSLKEDDGFRSGIILPPDSVKQGHA